MFRWWMDTKLRELERDGDAVGLLRMRLRTGFPRERIRLAAYCGDEASLEALGYNLVLDSEERAIYHVHPHSPALAIPKLFYKWFKGLPKEAAIRASYIACLPNSNASIDAVGAWLRDPGPETEERCSRAHSQALRETSFKPGNGACYAVAYSNNAYGQWTGWIPNCWLDIKAVVKCGKDPMEAIKQGLIEWTLSYDS